MVKKGLFCIVFILFSSCVFAQEAAKKEIQENVSKGTHQFTVVIGHSHVKDGIKANGEKGWRVIPSTGFDYAYWIANHWAVGLQNDIMVESFEVETHDKKVIERKTPFSSVATVIFKPKKTLSYIAGMGGEFAQEENFVITRLGIEAGWEMKNNWEFCMNLVYDLKWNGYDTWGFAFGITKLLRKK